MTKYILIENGKILHRSGDFYKLLNFTVRTKDAIITYNDVVVWVQNP